jgi:hypothetical protein
MILKNYIQFVNESEFDIIKSIATSYLKDETQAYENEDGTWSCDTHLNLAYKRDISHKGRLVVSFKEIKGTFKVDGLALTTLEGCPRIVDSFSCDNNNLTDLIGGPEIIKGKVTVGDYHANSNHLTSMKGIPMKVPGWLYLKNNKLEKMDVEIEYVNSFSISDNPLSSLEGKPKIIKNDFWFPFGMSEDRKSALPNKPSWYEHKFMESIKSDNYHIKGEYWVEFLKYMMKVHPSWDDVEIFEKKANWPEGFLNDTLIRSVKGTSKYNL